jgi:hypothetical protein
MKPLSVYIIIFIWKLLILYVLVYFFITYFSSYDHSWLILDILNVSYVYNVYVCTYACV